MPRFFPTAISIVSLLCAFAVLASTTSATAVSQFVSLDARIPESMETVAITGDGVTLTGSWTAPQTTPAGADLWTHTARESSSRALAGIEGGLLRDIFTSDGLRLSRETWLAESGEAFAARLRLTNTGSREIRLNTLTPLSLEEIGGLSFGGCSVADWTLFTQQRLKNGKPGAFVPDTSLSLDSDPFLLVDGGGHSNVLIGFVSQDYHMAGVRLEMKGGRDASLIHLRAECDFSGSVLPPGGERTSQWVYVIAGPEPEGLVSEFADRMARYRGVALPPENAPSVFCSWYYWGPWFSEKDLHGQLEQMGRQRVPFDVLLIDDCWTPYWGDWYANKTWPSGMRDAARTIHEAGYRAGIWTCPTLANENSSLAKEHPEWLLRQDDGSLVLFKMDGNNYVLDPTCPGVCDFIEETYRRLTESWGYDYLKLDFMRSVFINPRARCHDPGATSLEAYRMALEAIRRGAGPGTYISVCGGHFGASLGTADSQRSGSDVVGFWRNIIPFKQNILRIWMSRMWHVDPDAMMVRREEEQRSQEGHGILNVGRLSDIEARTVALNQYLGGEMITFCEDFTRLDEDRRALYRHVIPSIDSPSIPLDLLERPLPSTLLTRVRPLCDELEPWVTVAVVNWSDKARREEVLLTGKVTETMDCSEFVAFDFFSQKMLGVFDSGDKIDLGTLEPHQSALVRIAPWHGRRPVLAGTDLHFSGGGAEITVWRAEKNAASGRLDTGWNYPVRVTAVFPSDGKYQVRTTTVHPGQRHFRIYNR